jgi:hypothetical protein
MLPWWQISCKDESLKELSFQIQAPSPPIWSPLGLDICTLHYILRVLLICATCNYSSNVKVWIGCEVDKAFSSQYRCTNTNTISKLRFRTAFLQKVIYLDIRKYGWKKYLVWYARIFTSFKNYLVPVQSKFHPTNP